MPSIEIDELSELPDALISIEQLRYESLSYHLQLVAPSFSYNEPRGGDGRIVGLPDIVYSRMCHHARMLKST